MPVDRGEGRLSHGLCAARARSAACGSIAVQIVEDSAQLRIGEPVLGGKIGFWKPGIKGFGRFIPAPGLNRGGLSRRAQARLDV